METVKVTKAERQVLDAMRASSKLKGAVVAMVEAARSGELAGKSPKALAKASATLPAPKKASTVSIAEMKEVLRAADCLYDDNKIWKKLGARTVPPIPDAVIREAYKKGGRVILRCSSISEKTDALKEANHSGRLWGWSGWELANQKRVSKPQWIVVPSHVETSATSLSWSDVITSEMPLPTPEDWFSAIAYARLDGGRDPKGCEGLYAFTTEKAVVGSASDFVTVSRQARPDGFGFNLGVARFGPPRN